MTVTNCVIAGNFTGNGGSGQGGGVYANDSTMVLTNCTIVDNSASSASGGVARSPVATAVVFNSIVYNNVVDNGVSPPEIVDVEGGTIVNFSYTTHPTAGSLNLSEEDGLPMFVDAGAGDYSLPASSPCIDAGTNAFASVVPLVAPDVDILGNSRPYGPSSDDYDMGAYEVQVPAAPRAVVYANPFGDDSWTGTRANPFKTIGHALTAVADGGTVKLAAGDYNESVVATRPVTIDGDYTGTKATVTGIGSSSTIFTAGSPVTIDGLRILHDAGTPLYGGGIRSAGATTLVSNCVIEGNRVVRYGGGINGGGAERNSRS